MPSWRASPNGGHAVDEPEVDRLRRAPLLAGDGFVRDVEDFRGRRAVDVAVLGERARETRIARQVRHDAELDLRIVRRQQHLALRRHEGLADAPSFRRADRDVLQVRVARRQPPRHRNRLVIGRMHAPRLRVDLLGQLLRVVERSFASPRYSRISRGSG
jgi:hypothetical protein